MLRTVTNHLLSRNYKQKKIFSYVLHTTNTLTYFEHSLKKYIQDLKKFILAWIS